MVEGKANHQHLKPVGTAAAGCTAGIAAEAVVAVVVQAAEAVAALRQAFPYYQQKSQLYSA